MKTVSPSPAPQAPHSKAAERGRPLYRQIEAHLRHQIETGVFRPGDMLPSIRVLCEQFGGVSHLTARQAIKQLSEQNLVKSVPGRGTFVISNKVRARRIALVLPNLEDALFTKIARGAQSVMEAAGMRALILDSGSDWGKEVDNIHHLEDLPIHGAIIFPISHSDIASQVFKLQLDGFPFVLVDRYFHDIEAPCVVVDNYQGSYDLTSHLVGKSYRRIAWAGEVKSTAGQERLSGFRDALNEGGLACPRALVNKLEISPQTAYWPTLEKAVQSCVQAWLALKPRPEALVFETDFMALIGLRELKKAGLAVPRDIAVVGFDDVAEASSSDPPLTTVRQPMEQVGQEAAKMLLERLRDKNALIRKIRLPVQLVIRSSA